MPAPLAHVARRGLAPDLVTDQTSAHDPLNGYVPAGVSLPELSPRIPVTAQPYALAAEHANLADDADRLGGRAGIGYATLSRLRGADAAAGPSLTLHEVDSALARIAATAAS